MAAHLRFSGIDRPKFVFVMGCGQCATLSNTGGESARWRAQGPPVGSLAFAAVIGGLAGASVGRVMSER